MTKTTGREDDWALQDVAVLLDYGLSLVETGDLRKAEVYLRAAQKALDDCIYAAKPCNDTD